MAFGAQKIFPIDKRPSTAVGIGIPFNAPSVFNSTYFTKDAIKTNLINYFLTNTGERYLNPTFGGNLREFIFEQISEGNLDSLKETIQSKISTNFPQVIVEKLDILKSEDTNSIIVELTYNVRNTNIQDEIQLQFN